MNELGLFLSASLMHDVVKMRILFCWILTCGEIMTLNFHSILGGKEGVLVVWQLDTGKKKFLPRIGSPLLYFTYSPDPSLSSVSRNWYLQKC